MLLRFASRILSFFVCRSVLCFSNCEYLLFNSLIPKCLSLFIIKCLSPKIEIEKGEVVNLVKNHSFHIAYFIKNLSHACLSGADPSRADLLGTNLSHADLTRAYLLGTNLSHSDLTRAYLTHANLSKSIIINSLFNNVRISDTTNFINAIIVDPKFIDYIKKFTNKVPNKIESKKELKNILEERKYNQEYINDLLESSKLPD